MKKINRIVKAKQKNKLFMAVLGALLVFCFTASAFASNDAVPGSADVGPEISAAGGLQAGNTQASASESPSNNALQLPEASASPGHSPTQMEDKEQAEGAIRITTLEELRHIGIEEGYPLDGTYILGNDIDGQGIGWAPIGSEEAPFSGTFLGNGHIIKNVLIFPEHGTGIFGYFTGSISGLNLRDVKCGPGNSQGTLFGTVDGEAEIADICVQGAIHKRDESVDGMSGGLAAEIRQAKKIQNVQVYVHNPNEGKLDGAMAGKADAPAEVYENCLWSGAYANSAFGIDSPIDAADGVVTLKADPAYVTLGTGGQQTRVTADTQRANQFGLAFKKWQGSETILALDSVEGAAVTITSKEETGAEDVEAVYAKTWPDGEKTEVRFFTPVIISQSISVEKELEPLDPIFPNQISGVQPLMPAGSVLPLQIGAGGGTAEEEQAQISITRNPDDQTGEIGESVTFSVEAEGDNLAYQWQESMDGGQTWTDIPGATEREYTFTAAEEDYAKEFRCAVRPAQ